MKIIPTMDFNRGYKLSEATIQAEAYRRMMNEGIICYLEYKHERCRFDMVILLNKKIIAIVEFKSRYKDNDHLKPVEQTKQFQKYSQYGLPIYYCRRWAEINPMIDAIRNYIDEVNAF